MKFKVSDQVIITAGKDKGKKSEIIKLFPSQNKVLVKDVNLYTKHIKPMPMIGRSGDRVRAERPLPCANIAILNEKGEPDRIGYKVTSKGDKIRVFKKAGTEVKEPEIKEEETK